MSNTKKRALISVSDKTGIIEFAQELENLGYEIISTGGTASALKEAKVNVINVSDVTGFPECLDGRVKTLHPMIHAGILAIRDNSDHMKQICELGVTPIDIVAINLYPFKETILKEDVTREAAIEKIDIGGPAMLRSAAKNWQDVAVIINPSDYKTVINELKALGTVTKTTKLKLAYKVFEHTSAYDALIAGFLRKESGSDMFPDSLTLTFDKAEDMRYGENPHQKAAFYREIGRDYSGTLAEAEKLHGKELSFNNINDTDSAIDTLKEFCEPCAVAVKHANPCGVGVAENIYDAYIKAYNADPVSIFGGIIAFNRAVDDMAANEINKIFIEVVIAPDYTDKALEILKQKKNIRILKLPGISKSNRADMFDMKKIAGGLLVQELNTELLRESEIKFVTDKKPSDVQMQDLIFAMKVVKHIKSNGIVLANNNATAGIGAGQTNRINALEIAVKYAGEKACGSVMASDAFFPFDDCVEAAAKAGISAIIQPGGSIRDEDSIAACNKHGIPMIFTGIRHFKH